MFANRLKDERQKRNLSQRDFAKMLQISPSTVGMYEAGKRTPDYETLQRIATFFDVTIDYMIGKANDPRPITINDLLQKESQGISFSNEEQTLINKLKATLPPMKNYTVSTPGISSIPILGTIRAGLPILAQEHIEDYLEIPDYMCGDFVLEVKGDSMIGVGILDGDLAICKYSEEPQTGQIVVARKDVSTEYSEATLKFYFNGSGNPVLRAANPNYPDIDYHGERYTTAGRVVAIVRRDAPGYELYTDFLSVKDNEEWTEVIEVAAANGLAPQDLISLVNINLKMIKRLKG